MKDISETHPSLCDKYGDMLMVVQDLQEHTIDKAVLRNAFFQLRLLFQNKHITKQGLFNAILSIEEELGLEKEE